MLKKETGVLHFQGLAHYTGWWIGPVYKFYSYHLQPYLTWASGDVSRAKVIFQAVDVSGKILYGKLGSPDYACTVNGTSANSILLVKLFYTLEPLGPAKRLCQGRSRSDVSIDLCLRQHIPPCDTGQPLGRVPMHSVDWFLPEQLLWKPHLQLVGDRDVAQEGAAQIFTGKSGNFCQFSTSLFAHL